MAVQIRRARASSALSQFPKWATGCPTTAGRIAALEAVAMIAQAGPLATILMDPHAPDLTGRGWVLDGLNVLYTGTESGWETDPNYVAMLALAERSGLRSRPAFAEVPDGVEEADAEEARGEEIVDDYVALLAKTRALRGCAGRSLT